MCPELIRENANGNALVNGNSTGNDNANAFGFALKVPMSEVENIEKLLNDHYEFMQKTHSVTGEKEIRLNIFHEKSAAVRTFFLHICT